MILIVLRPPMVVLSVDAFEHEVQGGHTAGNRPPSAVALSHIQPLRPSLIRKRKKETGLFSTRACCFLKREL